MEFNKLSIGKAWVKKREDVWLIAIGKLLDQWEIHKQFIGMAKPKIELFIDEIIPVGI